jgi:hypothetical protein
MIFRINCFSVSLMAIGNAFKLSIFNMGDEIFRLSTLLLVLGLLVQTVILSRDGSIKNQGLRFFFGWNSFVIAFCFAAILIKTGHLGLDSIKHISFDVFATILLTSSLVYSFSIVDRLISAPVNLKTLIHRHITFVFIFLILDMIYMTLYSETTNRLDIMEMIEELR